jgi:Ser/Thr protein kinase RdoA (MazF antagonist)
VTRVIEPPEAILENWDLDPSSVERLPGGHINSSFGVRRHGGSACVLQHVNPIFPPEVNDDIDAVTTHLAGKGLTTPRVLRDRAGRRHVAADRGFWRLMTRIEGETRETVRTDREAFEAARVLGEFHDALSDFDRPLGQQRPGVHDLAKHLATLRRTLDDFRQHQAFADVIPVAERILALAEKHGATHDTPPRLVHGDPKISNVIFERGDTPLGAGHAICLIDLDTIARMPIAVELGDALRSWCNPAGEDSPEAHFEITRFDAAIEGYAGAAGTWLTVDEWRDVPGATLGIAIELAARFAADALAESYFGWDPARFESASRHNLARARAQLALAIDIERQLDAMRAAVTRT